MQLASETRGIVLDAMALNDVMKELLLPLLHLFIYLCRSALLPQCCLLLGHAPAAHALHMPPPVTTANPSPNPCQLLPGCLLPN